MSRREVWFKMSNLNKRGISPYLMSLIATAVMQTANLATGVILARGLGPTSRGELAALSALVLTATQLTGLSLAESLAYWLSKGRKDYRIFVSSGLVVALALGLIGSAALIVLAPTLERIVSEPLDALWPWLLFPLVAQATHYFVAVARGLERHRAWAALRVSTTVNYALLLTCFLFASAVNARNIGIALVGGQLLSIVFSCIVLWRYLHVRLVSRDALRSIIVYAVKYHPASFSWLAREQFDKVILFYFVSAADLGHYVVGIALGFLPMAVVTAIDQVVFPALVGIADGADRKSACLILIRSVVAMVLVGMFVTLPLIPFAVNVLFGADYAVASDLQTAAVAIGFLQALRLALGIGLRIEQKPGVLGLNEMLGVVATFAFMVPCVLVWGIYGAPLASGLGGFLSLSLTLTRTKELFNVSILDLILLNKGDISAFWERVSR